MLVRVPSSGLRKKRTKAQPPRSFTWLISRVPDSRVRSNKLMDAALKSQALDSQDLGFKCVLLTDWKYTGDSGKARGTLLTGPSVPCPGSWACLNKSELFSHLLPESPGNLLVQEWLVATAPL